MVQNHQNSMQPSPCSETTEPISINDTPLDAPWSESVPFWILLKLVHVKWTKLVYVFMSSMSEPVTSYNISGLALGWIESYLSQRSQRVVLDGKHSDWIPVQSGVPEGSILGPILFTCYVADLPNQIKTSSLSYADDVKIFHRIKSPEDARSLQANLTASVCGLKPGS